MEPVKLNDDQLTRLYRYGNSHFHAADLIYEKLPTHMPKGEQWVTSRSLAMHHIEFGIELKFKYLHVQEHGEFMPIHSLDILFKGGTIWKHTCKELSKDTQHAIDNAFQQVTGMKFLRFYNAYRDIWNQRYLFAEEKHEQLLDGNLYLPLKDKLNEVLESVSTRPLKKRSEKLSILIPLVREVDGDNVVFRPSHKTNLK